MERNPATPKFPVIKTECPHCHESAVFDIAFQEYKGFKVFGIRFLRNTADGLRCSSCGYFQFIEDADLPKWKELSWKYDDLITGEIPEEEFDEYVASLDIPLLTELMESAETWKCACGESNPLNFPNCWKCGAACDIAPEESEQQIDLRNRYR